MHVPVNLYTHQDLSRSIGAQDRGEALWTAANLGGCMVGALVNSLIHSFINSFIHSFIH